MGQTLGPALGPARGEVRDTGSAAPTTVPSTVPTTMPSTVPTTVPTNVLTTCSSSQHERYSLGHKSQFTSLVLAPARSDFRSQRTAGAISLPSSSQARCPLRTWLVAGGGPSTLPSTGSRACLA
jgi:hypothetical protein